MSRADQNPAEPDRGMRLESAPGRGRFVSYPQASGESQSFDIQRVGVVFNTDALGEFPYRIVVPILPALGSLGKSPLSVAVTVPREGRGSSRVEARLLVNIEQFLLPRKLVSQTEVAEWEADEEMKLLLVPERMVSCPSRVLVDLGLGLNRQSMAELAAATSILLQLQDGGK